MNLSALFFERAASLDDVASDSQKLGALNHEQMRVVVANRVYGLRGGRPRKITLAIEKIAIFREAHADERIGGDTVKEPLARRLGHCPTSRHILSKLSGSTDHVTKRFETVLGYRGWNL